MKLEPKPRDPNDSPFFKFEKIGDSIRGMYVKYGPVNGQFGIKNELVLRTREGDQKIISCGAQLTNILDNNLAQLRGKVLTVTYISNKDTGKGNLMKVFDVDADEPKMREKKSETAPAPEPEDEDIPF